MTLGSIAVIKVEAWILRGIFLFCLLFLVFHRYPVLCIFFFLSSFRGLEMVVYMFHDWLLGILYACIVKPLALSYHISHVCLYVE